MTRRPVQLRGFTLIELILVLVIASIMLAMAAPSLRGWGRGQKLRNAGDDFLAATGYARTQAVAHAAVYAVEIDAAANAYVVKSVGRDGVRKAVPGDFGRPATLPEAFTIRLTSGGGTTAAVEGPQPVGVASVVFYPDGRNTPATIDIATPDNDAVRLVSDSPAEPFRKVDVPK